MRRCRNRPISGQTGKARSPVIPVWRKSPDRSRPGFCRPDLAADHRFLMGLPDNQWQRTLIEESVRLAPLIIIQACASPRSAAIASDSIFCDSQSLAIGCCTMLALAAGSWTNRGGGMVPPRRSGNDMRV